ncbi:Bax inhibitor-1/YccA family protein [Desulfohalobiaceae bacterium Ax17]|uniref:Bax inhibitor-1/YccA family protein n=1 Tax=Desulfovulcanus ferrireducens TaxID=2831190 RepID=UPI00207BC6AC|nr:Bax inhibitor-1/YccA family protein [Desulfovulcanus ferrireducens]MBT8763703.1 Bax inhibitor-1/YccA family protein [Desulfovulcanus ferrireducens]
MADFRTYSTPKVRTEVLNVFMRGVYQWMAIGLGLTALVAYFVASSPILIQAIFGNPLLFWGLIIGELLLVVGISGGITRLSASAATSLFLVYSGLNGITLSAVLLIYTATSIASTFVVCAGMFAAMSIYGLTTKKDLTSWGSFLFMGLVGIILTSIVNIFLKSPAVHFVISGIGVIIFVGLTAYDTQKLKVMGESAPLDDSLAMRRGTILGALTLYLDFINLFLMLLRFFGQSRD